jgi:hypothetical protein
MGAYNSGVYSLAQAIAQNEGFTNGSSQIAINNNNPGNLEDSQGNILSFSSLASGWDALYSKLQNIANGNSTVYPANESLQAFAQTYSGTSSSAANNYSSILGVPTSTPMSQILGSTTPNIAGVPFPSSWTPAQIQAAQQDYAASNAVSPTVTSAIVGVSKYLGNNGSSWLPSLEDTVIIIVGILLLAAGLFSFKTTQTIVTTAGRVAKRGGELLA